MALTFIQKSRTRGTYQRIRRRPAKLLLLSIDVTESDSGVTLGVQDSSSCHAEEKRVSSEKVGLSRGKEGMASVKTG